MEWSQEAIKQALLQGTITPQEAIDRVTKLGAKPWSMKQWEKIRSERIGPVCTQCGSTKPPQVLQHLWHPRPFKVIIGEIRDRYRKVHELDYPRQEVAEPDKVERPACPKCQSVNVRQRKKTSNWLCAFCRHEFLEPVVVWALTPTLKAARSKAKQEAYDQWYQAFRGKTDEQGPELR